MYKGIMANNKGTTMANPFPNALIIGVYFGLLRPIDWKALLKPCNK
jgi:hypothetical protein